MATGASVLAGTAGASCSPRELARCWFRLWAFSRYSAMPSMATRAPTNRIMRRHSELLVMAPPQQIMTTHSATPPMRRTMLST